MILSIVKSIGSLASSYVDGKVQTQKIKAEIQKKQLTGEIDWDLEAIRATQSSWKDEWLTILLSLPFLLCFISDTTREMAFAGFQALEQAPRWYTYSFGVVIAEKKKKATKSKKKKGATPTNPALYARVKAEAKRKFKVYPSAYANGWLVRTYKKRGGGYR
jgi:hypothetical protein